MRALGVVELQGARDRVEDGRGCTGDRTALELGVVLDAHSRQGRDLVRRRPATRRFEPALMPAASGVSLLAVT